MRRFAFVLCLFACVLLLPTIASAQAALSGLVQDTSGAVLPGVTVEAASPVLIEKVRTTVTDGNGRYIIPDLRPGEYTVTFTLTGFATVRREGVVLTGTQVVTINADMRVGALEETITVSGETPVVDVQSTTRQAVIDQEV
ncbi:MAG TPA: carboxypeptidase-like regulatory domain-containing protein, partial [Vicinamibacterales bacterium]